MSYYGFVWQFNWQYFLFLKVSIIINRTLESEVHIENQIFHFYALSFADFLNWNYVQTRHWTCIHMRVGGAPHGVSCRVHKHCTQVHPRRFCATKWWLWCDSWHRTIQAGGRKARKQHKNVSVQICTDMWFLCICYIHQCITSLPSTSMYLVIINKRSLEKKTLTCN